MSLEGQESRTRKDRNQGQERTRIKDKKGPDRVKTKKGTVSRTKKGQEDQGPITIFLLVQTIRRISGIPFIGFWKPATFPY